MPVRPTPPTPEELKSERIDEERHPLALWKLTEDGRSLALSHQFAQRATAMAFLGLTTKLAEVGGACPKIEHVLGQVTIGLTTYEEGAVTEQDRALAEVLERSLRFFEATEKPA